MAIKTYVTGSSTLTVADNDTTVFGGTAGSEKVKILAGVTGAVLDANIEKIDLAGNLADYKFAFVAGVGTQIQNATGAVIVTIPSLNQDAVVAFADGSAKLTQTGATAFSLGNQAIGTTAAAITTASLGTAFDATVKSSVTSSTSTTGVVGTQLKTTQDDLVGTAGDDLFQAFIFDNSNTLQSGDKIDGGAGTDTLFADIGNSQKFAITPVTANVENIKLRAEAISTDSTDNNTASTSEVQIDAQRTVGVNYWEDNNSRADLLIEDIRILPSQITKDITIAMVETDPGHVDYGVYFDQYSLRAQSNSSSTLTIELADTRSLVNNGPALKDNPYWGFKFLLNGKEETVTSDAIDNAQSYAELLVAVRAAVAANPDLAGVTVDLGSEVTRSDTLSGQTFRVTPLILKSSSGALSVVASGDAWLAKNGVPASSGLHTYMTTAVAASTDKVTSKVILDDVGRGSTGGDLVIGGLSVGDTSTSLGVERFEIEVRDNSKLQTINSTNNTLQEVTIVNGPTSSNSFAYVNTVKDSGNLTVNGDVIAPKGNSNIDTIVAPASVSAQAGTTTRAAATDTNYGTGIDTALPGSQAQHNAYGFSDVRLIDASAFKGKLAFTAEITDRAIAKYTNLVDTQTDTAVETRSVGNNGFGTGSIANFEYTGGQNDDTIVVDIDAKVAASRSTMVVGREDFTFNVNGGAGDDAITVRLVGNTLVGGNENWYDNQNINSNVTLSGGDGNDTIRKPGAGNVSISGGTGDDAIYADNSGVQQAITYNEGRATWVFNAVDVDVNNLQSQAAASVKAVNAQLTVNFEGIPSKTITIANSKDSLTNVTITDLHINQAIKQAINTDPVLSKLLVAEDGAGHSLVVRSLIDGEIVSANDLSVAFSSTALTPSQSALTGASAVTLFNAATITSTALGDGYVSTLGVSATNTANNNGVTSVGGNAQSNVLTGADSITSSDNTIEGGAGNDVIVLGTTAGNNELNSSNDVVKFAPGFGSDTIVHFDGSNGVGRDFLDFTGLFTPSATAPAPALASVTTDRSITVGGAITVPAGSSEKTEVEKLFAAANSQAQEHVYVVVNAKNVGNVYTITDPSGASNAVATLQGSINLAKDASGYGNWAAANFGTGITKTYSGADANTSTSTGTGTTVNTINGIGSFKGTAAAEKISGSAGNDVIVGMRGDDTINAGAGSDNVVLLGNYDAQDYAAIGGDIAGWNNGISKDGADRIPNTADDLAARLVFKGTVNGENINPTDVDTLTTYGAIDLTQATITGFEQFVFNSNVALKASQIQQLGTTGKITVNGAGSHLIVVQNDLAAGQTLNLDNIVVATGGNVSVTTQAASANVGTVTTAGTYVAPTTVSLSSSASTINEGQSVTYTATLSSALTTATTVPYTVTGTGITTADFGGAALTGNITIPAGATTGTVTFNAANDTTTEGNETLAIALGTASNGVTAGTTTTASTVIVDTSTTVAALPTIALTATPASVNEGSAITYVATLSAIATAPVTVPVTLSGTGITTADFTGLSALATTITVPAGSTNSSVTVTTAADAITEGNETLVATLGSVTGYTAGTATASTTIVDSSIAPGTSTVNLSASAASINEGQSVTFTATLSSAATSAVTVPYTLSGTGITTADFTPALSALTGNITIAAGSTTGTVTLTAANDTTTEGNETLTATLGTVTGYTAGTSSVSTTIVDTSLTGAGFNGNLTAAGTATATSSADIFKLVGGTTSGYETTIKGGFNYLTDKIQVPVGTTNPSALAGGVNNVADGAVDLTWSNNGNLVIIHLTGVDANTEVAMQANAVSSTVFGTY